MSKRQRSDQVSSQADVARRGLVSVNKLDYVLQPDLSVCVARSSKKHFFQQNTYAPSNRAICTFNSGAEYVDPQNSYLKFTVLTSAGTTLALGCGSGCSFIKQIVLTSRSGDDIERIENVGDLAPVLDRYLNSKQWLETTGRMIGYQVDDLDDAANGFTADSSDVVKQGKGTQVTKVLNGQAYASATRHTFIIPLGCLSGLFKSFDRLLPSMLMSGMRFEIEFEDTAEVGLYGTASPAAWSIENPEIILDQYQLTDSIMRVLNEEAALRGLEVVFTTWYNHETILSGDQINVQVRKAVSRALGVLTRVMPQRTTTGNVIKKFSHENLWKEFQLRLGSLYFPQQSIKDATTNAVDTLNNVQLYHHTMRGFGKFKNSLAETSIRPIDFLGDPTTDNRGLHAIYTDLERSSVQKLTGIPINNSRVAEIIGTYTGGSGKRLNSYLHYVRLLRVFMQNVEVEE